MDDYQYTVFVSYHRGKRLANNGQHELSASGRWVHEVLVPELRTWLRAEDPDATIAFDGDLTLGDPPEPALQRRLKYSRCMLAVWSPEYFRSYWCRTEWHSMLKREAQHGGGVLVVPIRFSDGKHFDAEATARCSGDVDRMERYTSLRGAHHEHVRWLEYIDQVKWYCQRILERAEAAPDWCDSFPWVPTAPLSKASMKKPSLQSGGHQ